MVKSFFNFESALGAKYREYGNQSLSHKLGIEQSERASERMSAVERASEASSAEKVNQ